jgi:hypothetical protein
MNRLIFASLALALTACGHTCQCNTEQAEAVPERRITRGAESATAPSDVSRSLAGTLHYTEVPHTMSVEAYLGVAFRVETGSESVALRPAGAVTEAALQALDGKQVRLTCIPRPPTKPNLYEQYPLGPDGEPMARPSFCELQTIEAVE